MIGSLALGLSLALHAPAPPPERHAGAEPPSPAAVHAHLVSSVPAAGDTLRELPPAVRLVFSEPVEEAFSEIVITASNGERTELRPRRDPGDVRGLTADLPALPADGYRLDWRIVSADGHPISGSFDFYVAASPADSIAAPVTTLPAAPQAAADAHPAHGAPAGETGEPPVAAATVRALALGSLMALAGLLALMAWVVPGPFGRLHRLALALATLAPLLLAGDFLLWLQHASPDRRLTPEVLETALATRSGLVGALRVGLALLALWAVGLARRPGLGAVFAAAALLLSAGTGHPAAIRPELAVPAKAVHLLAVAVWLGGLLLLLAADRGDERFRLDAFRVSGLALAAVLLIGVTGVLQTLLFLPSPLDAFRSTYGWLALAKLGGLAVLIGFGAVNRYRLLPALREGDPPAGLRRSVRVETLVMAAVILLGAFLAYVPPPQADDGAVASREGAPSYHDPEHGEAR